MEGKRAIRREVSFKRIHCIVQRNFHPNWFGGNVKLLGVWMLGPYVPAHRARLRIRGRWLSCAKLAIRAHLTVLFSA